MTRHFVLEPMTPSLEREFVEGLLASGMVERTCSCGTWFLTRRTDEHLCPPCRAQRIRTMVANGLRLDARECRRLGEFDSARLAEECALAIEQGWANFPLHRIFRGIEPTPSAWFWPPGESC